MYEYIPVDYTFSHAHSQKMTGVFSSVHSNPCGMIYSNHAALLIAFVEFLSAFLFPGFNDSVCVDISQPELNDILFFLLNGSYRHKKPRNLLRGLYFIEFVLLLILKTYMHRRGNNRQSD